MDILRERINIRDNWYYNLYIGYDKGIYSAHCDIMQVDGICCHHFQYGYGYKATLLVVNRRSKKHDAEAIEEYKAVKNKLMELAMGEAVRNGFTASSSESMDKAIELCR